MSLLESIIEDGLNLVLVGGPETNSVSRAVLEILKNTSFGMHYREVGGDANRAVGTPSYRDGEWVLGSCAFDGVSPKDKGIMFTFPMTPIEAAMRPSQVQNVDTKNKTLSGSTGVGPTRNRIGIIMFGGSDAALEDVAYHSFSSAQALTRAPFSNMYADFFVTGPEYRRKGLGGLLAAGYWGNAWQLDERNAWMECI
jgi:hypothetical protein